RVPERRSVVTARLGDAQRGARRAAPGGREPRHRLVRARAVPGPDPSAGPPGPGQALRSGPAVAAARRPPPAGGEQRAGARAPRRGLPPRGGDLRAPAERAGAGDRAPRPRPRDRPRLRALLPRSQPAVLGGEAL